MNQIAIDFSAHTLVRNSDPFTSVAAAMMVKGFKGKHEAAIFGAICDADNYGATYREIAEATRMEPVAVGRRLSAMGKRGLIVRDPLTDCSGFVQRNGMCVWWKA